MRLLLMQPPARALALSQNEITSTSRRDGKSSAEP
jgi:hypothetical protein